MFVFLNVRPVIDWQSTQGVTWPLNTKDMQHSLWLFGFADWYLGSSKWPKHDRQPEGEDNQRVRFPFQSILDHLHHTGNVFFYSSFWTIAEAIVATLSVVFFSLSIPLPQLLYFSKMLKVHIVVRGTLKSSDNYAC